MVTGAWPSRSGDVICRYIIGTPPRHDTFGHLRTMMLRVIFVLLFASSAWGRSARIFEGSITDSLQEHLGPYDPLTITDVQDIHLIGDHSDFMLSAFESTVSGFKMVKVTTFDPPVPPFSNKMTMKLMIPVFEAKTNNYTMTGSHEGEAVVGTGSAQLQFAGVRMTLNMKTTNYHLTPPSVCIKAGTLNLQLTYDGVQGHLDGLDMINAHLSDEVGPMVANMVAELNANSKYFEDAFNSKFCK
ncbi:uncharacterized protein LOC143032399 [Oratosquilla oratoria]|uniref:uncharacterized protein LOC143032399 n=1 Tax=Oratosquilla oratoria TaxID=337810 RepID=UPI003F759E08